LALALVEAAKEIHLMPDEEGLEILLGCLLTMECDGSGEDGSFVNQVFGQTQI